MDWKDVEIKAILMLIYTGCFLCAFKKDELALIVAIVALVLVIDLIRRANKEVIVIDLSKSNDKEEKK